LQCVVVAARNTVFPLVPFDSLPRCGNNFLGSFENPSPIWHVGPRDEGTTAAGYSFMFRFSAIVLTALCTAGSVSAASWADTLFEESTKDFGAVPRGPLLRHSFAIKNTRNEPVRISNVRVSCGCVTATESKKVLQPGEEGSIDITMDTTRFTGLKSVTVFVRFDSPRSEEVQLWVKANGRDDISLNPQAFAFGTVKRGTSPTVSLTLTLLGSNQYKVLEGACDSNYLKITFKEERKGTTDVAYQVTATLRHDAPVGRWYTDVWIKTNHPTMEKIRVPLTVEIESPLSISPSLLSLGEVKAGTEVERKVILRGIKAFKVTQIDGLDDALSVKDSAVDAQEVHVLTVKFKPGKGGDFNRSVKIITDMQGSNDIEFRTTAQVVPSEEK